MVVPQVYPLPEIDVVKECATRLMEDAGKRGKDAQKLPDLYRKHAMLKDVEFLEYMLSVIYVESRFNRNAHSEKDAMGLMQLTIPAVEDAVKHCNLRPVLDMEHMLDSATNIRYGSCYLKKLLEDMDGDWTRTLIVYNGGYKQLTRYDRGESIVPETANYVIQVNRALNTICRASSTNTRITQ